MTREMKDSGIEWVRKIPIDWSAIKIKYICTINSGEYISKDEYVENGIYEIIGANGKIGYLNECNNSEKVLTTGRVGTIGTVHKIQCAWITDNTLIIKPNEKIDYDYLYWAIPNLDYKEMTSGTAMPLITASKLLKQKIPYPSIEEQQKIANFLDNKISKIDEILEKTHHTIDEYKKLKQAVITEAVTKGLDPNVEMRNSGIDWIGTTPKNWELTKINSICSMHSGNNITSNEINPDVGNYEVYGGNGFRGYFDKYNISGEYILIGRQGALAGNVHMINGNYWATDHALIVDNKNFIQNCYLYLLFIAMNLNKYAFETAAQPGLAASKILNLKIVFPKDKLEQQQIVEYLDKKCSEIDTLIEKKEQIIKELEAYKKSLIYECVTGKMEIK